MVVWWTSQNRKKKQKKKKDFDEFETLDGESGFGF